LPGSLFWLSGPAFKLFRLYLPTVTGKPSVLLSVYPILIEPFPDSSLFVFCPGQMTLRQRSQTSSLMSKILLPKLLGGLPLH
jgi:hypothetical protein